MDLKIYSVTPKFWTGFQEFGEGKVFLRYVDRQIFIDYLRRKQAILTKILLFLFKVAKLYPLLLSQIFLKKLKHIILL